MKDIIKNILQKAARHKTLVQNFSYLSVLRTFNMLLPLIAYPYLIRVLGKEMYGLVIFAQAVIGYLVILVSFGFNITATKEVSVHRDNKEKLSEIVSSVLIIKGLLFLGTVLVLAILLNFIPQAKDNEPLFYFTLWMCLYELMFPMWYFQGIEQMKYITYITLASRLIFLCLIFVFIQAPSDYLYIPIINGFGAVIAGGTSLYIVFIKHHIKFRFLGFTGINSYFKDSLIIFISRVSSLKDNTPTFLIGIFLGNESVAYYDLANKVVRVIISIFDNVTNVVFPFVAKMKDLNLNRKVVKLELFSLLFSYALLCIFAEKIILILGGEEMLPSRILFYILGLLIIRPLSSLIGTTVLITNNLTKEFSRNLIYSTIFYFFITLLLFLFRIVSIYSLAVTIVLALFFELGHRIYLIKKRNLAHWII